MILEKKSHNYFSIELKDTFNLGVCGKSINTIDYNREHSHIRKEEKNLLAALNKLPQENILFLHQVHKDTIHIVESPDNKNKSSVADADAMITNQKEICLVIRTADCVPVFLIDMEKCAIAAIHSGWRSTELEITSKAILKMKDVYNSNPTDIKAFILPGICGKSYEVKMDVASHFSKDDYIEKDGKQYLDLQIPITRQLIQSGVIPDNIDSSSQCTLIDNNEFFSHRCGDKGRNLNFIFMK